MSYPITRDYIDIGNARSGKKLAAVRFIVSHDTGNPGSTAYNNRNYFQNSQPNASAHTFIDDNYILEIIPLDEKAWHVRYQVAADNQRFGVNANDAAIGVELCYGGKINFQQAYNRYVWYHAYLCNKFSLNPTTDIVSHSSLDPSRRTDPENALRQNGISWHKFLQDVQQALQTIFQPQKDAESVVKGVSAQLPIRLHDKGQFVKELQQNLITAGFPLPRFGADGHFGAETEAAVRQFQQTHRLTVDGIVGNATLTKLSEALKSNKSSIDFPLPTKILKRGMQGNEVKQLQRALMQLRFNPGAIDGIYGQKTEAAVRSFQSTIAALKNDGIYGPQTRHFLLEELKKQQ